MGYALALFAIMAPAGRMHGIGGLPGSRVISTALFVIGFGIAAAAIWSPWAFPLGAISGIGIALGHGNFYAMTGARDAQGFVSEPEAIEKIFRPLYVRLGGDIKRPAYSYVMMGLKGLIIGLPALPYSIPLAVGWPAAYGLSFRFTQDSALAEWVTGAIAGATIALVVALKWGFL